MSVSSRLVYDDHNINKGRPTLLDSVLTFGMTLVNACTAYGRQWIVTVFRTAAVTTTITLVAIIMYILYEGLTGLAWEEQPALKDARVA